MASASSATSGVHSKDTNPSVPSSGFMIWVQYHGRTTDVFQGQLEEQIARLAYDQRQARGAVARHNGRIR